MLTCLLSLMTLLYEEATGSSVSLTISSSQLYIVALALIIFLCCVVWIMVITCARYSAKEKHMMSEMTKMETNRGASQLRKYSINYSVAPCAGKCMQCSRVCSDNRVIEELLQQLPKHLILRSNEVRMLDISLGQGMLETITALKVITCSQVIRPCLKNCSVYSVLHFL